LLKQKPSLGLDQRRFKHVTLPDAAAAFLALLPALIFLFIQQVLIIRISMAKPPHNQKHDECEQHRGCERIMVHHHSYAHYVIHCQLKLMEPENLQVNWLRDEEDD
jgi:hypothetical protein